MSVGLRLSMTHVSILRVKRHMSIVHGKTVRTMSTTVTVHSMSVGVSAENCLWHFANSFTYTHSELVHIVISQGAMKGRDLQRKAEKNLVRVPPHADPLRSYNRIGCSEIFIATTQLWSQPVQLLDTRSILRSLGQCFVNTSRFGKIEKMGSMGIYKAWL